MFILLQKLEFMLITLNNFTRVQLNILVCALFWTCMPPFLTVWVRGDGVASVGLVLPVVRPMAGKPRPYRTVALLEILPLWENRPGGLSWLSFRLTCPIPANSGPLCLFFGRAFLTVSCWSDLSLSPMHERSVTLESPNHRVTRALTYCSSYCSLNTFTV